ncbi:MAG: hypothetical protein WBO23_17670, partial [Burkholderiales bacterium]
MKRSDTLSIRPLFFAAALALAGCGSGGGGDGAAVAPPPPANTAPVANAGADIEVSKTFSVTLNGSGSDADGDTLAYTWTQTKGPDVTGGAGTLSGASPSFSAPDAVDTLVFSLVVSDGTENSAADTVFVNVFEDQSVRYFVDGDSGDDTTGTGSRDNPFKTIAKAVTQLTGNLEDIYVMTRAVVPPAAAPAAYDETAGDLVLPAGTSLYGGYDANWVRNAQANKTLVNTNHRGVRFENVTLDAWFSGFDLVTADSPSATDDVFGVFGSGTAALHVQDNVIATGNVEAGQDLTPGSNYGVALSFLSMATITNNVITAGEGGDGINGLQGLPGDDGDDGQNGDQTGGRSAPGGNTGLGGNGGGGGTRGGGLGGDGGGG